MRHPLVVERPDGPRADRRRIRRGRIAGVEIKVEVLPRVHRGPGTPSARRLGNVDGTFPKRSSGAFSSRGEARRAPEPFRPDFREMGQAREPLWLGTLFSLEFQTGSLSPVSWFAAGSSKLPSQRSASLANRKYLLLLSRVPETRRTSLRVTTMLAQRYSSVVAATRAVVSASGLAPARVKRRLSPRACPRVTPNPPISSPASREILRRQILWRVGASA